MKSSTRILEFNEAKQEFRWAKQESRWRGKILEMYAAGA